ncbi:hypothetical protein LCGC14_2671850, partial [marine sediment metagenome]
HQGARRRDGDVRITKDERFSRLIRPLTADENQGLRESIEAEGCRDPLVVWKHEGKNILLDGYHRLDICARAKKPYHTVARTFDDAKAAAQWVCRNQESKRNLSPDERADMWWEFAEAFRTKRAKPKQSLTRGRGLKGAKKVFPKRKTSFEPQHTDKHVAKNAHVPVKTASNVKTVRDKGTSDEKAAMRSGEKTSGVIAKDIRKRAKDKRLADERRREAKRRADEMSKSKDVRKKRIERDVEEGDFRKIAAKMPKESVDLIFTDPPYDRKSVPMYGDLAEMGARVLKPGGSLVCYAGHYVVPDIINLITPHLRFWWVLACVHTGRKAQMREYGIKVCWKPMLWFVKGTRARKEDWVDDIVLSEREKDEHGWQQSIVEASYYIENLSPEGGMVFDPFCGGGTTAVVAERLGRRWKTCDEDGESVDMSRGRILNDDWDKPEGS